ncbi:MAG: rhamnulokinase family protein [Candidatus Aminicenantaceae bacterium]
MEERSFLAFDVGAESGRAMLGRLKDGILLLEEKARFANGMIHVMGHWRWNIFRLFEDIVQALKLSHGGGALSPVSLGVDTWGVDFGLLGPGGSILDLPVAYRDSRTEGIMDEVFLRIPRERIYGLTGIQFLRFNSLFQLYALRRSGSPLLDIAQDLLFIPDLLLYMLTGNRSTEFTYATTSQLYNPVSGDWEPELFDLLDLPLSLMQPAVPPGTRVGTLLPELAQETGLGEIPAVAVASHDTASAVAAVPAEDKGWAYISSGTWSLMGIEVDAPILDPLALELNFTNEGGAGGRFRFLKNICGLWLLQACRRSWQKDLPSSYTELVRAAEAAPAFRSMVDPDAESFLNPVDMPEAIREYCRRSHQPVPEQEAAVTRCILESLSLKYRYVLDQLHSLAPDRIERLHVIGGGSRNALLNQFTANATGLPVRAGPAEAAAVGNVLIQAQCLGDVEDLAEIRRIVRRSFSLDLFEPQDTRAWEHAYMRFQDLLRKG